MKQTTTFFRQLSCKNYFWLYLVVGITYSIISVVAPTFSGKLVDAVIYQQGDVRKELLLLVLVYLLLLVFSIADQKVFHSFLIKEKKMMRSKAAASFMRKKGLNREEISEFESFVNNDIPNIAENYFIGIVDILKCVCIAVCISLELFNVHWLLAVIIVGSSLLIVTMPKLLSEKAAKSRQKYSEALGKYNTILESFLGGADIVKAFSYERKASIQIQEKNDRIEEDEQRVRNCHVGIYAIAGGLQILKRFLILAVGVYLIYVKSIKVGGLLVAVQLAEVLAAPAEMLAYLLNAKNEVKPLLKQYSEILKVTETEGKIEVGYITQICLENLSYEIDDLKILNNISCKFEAGKKYMLVGKSGSGKSTLLKVLGSMQRFEYGGHVYVNKSELKHIDKSSFYEKVAIVPQEPYLFWSSLKENIVMGRDVSEEVYENIIRKLNLTYLMERFANQELDEEAVVNLSGGEKQRIALARAMIGKPEVYLLDEITASLDMQNAYEIEKMILDENAMVIHACHKIVPELQEKYEVIYL